METNEQNIFYIVENNVTTEIIEKKSRFIANIFHVESVEIAEEKIKEIKKTYHDAKHNCFAYAIETGDGGIAVKYNDDGEPSGTAGAPMLKVILGKNMSNTLVIVTRYFGGVLLGTGGLVKAYTEATQKALNEAKLKKQANGQELLITIAYEELDKIKYYLTQNNIKISKINYLDNIEIAIEIALEKIDIVINDIDNNSIKILKYDILNKKFIDI